MFEIHPSNDASRLSYISLHSDEKDAAASF